MQKLFKLFANTKLTLSILIYFMAFSLFLLLGSEMKNKSFNDIIFGHQFLTLMFQQFMTLSIYQYIYNILIISFISLICEPIKGSVTFQIDIYIKILLTIVLGLALYSLLSLLNYLLPSEILKKALSTFLEQPISIMDCLSISLIVQQLL